MFRVIKALNNNSVLAIDIDTNKEYILFGKGIGFGKKINERMQAPQGTQIYLLQQKNEKGVVNEMINLDGKGFKTFVKEGDKIKAHDKLLGCDLEFIKNNVSPCICTALNSK